MILLCCILSTGGAGQREGVQAVIAALETAPRLRRLGLAGCRLGADGGQAMIATIGAGKKRFRLLDLDLAHNSLGDGCGEALTIALRRNETLTRLSLRCGYVVTFLDSLRSVSLQ